MNNFPARPEDDKKILIGCSIAMFLALVLSGLFGYYVGVATTKPVIYLNPVIRLDDDLPTPNAEPQTEEPIIKTYKGTASWYGEDEGECLGCPPFYKEDGSIFYYMRNGQILDEDQMTLAFHHAPMNSTVRVKNINSGKIVEAKVTDTGGFEEGYSRIADLSEGLKNALLCEDLCEVEVIL